MTLLDLCDYLHNNFEACRFIGEIKIEDGKVVGVDLEDDRYFRIIGSAFNDGIYKFSSVLELKDEVFDGAIVIMSVPPYILDMVTEISNWESENANSLASPYQSESFGGYSYSKATSSTGGMVTWRDVFAKRLSRYKKI